MGGFFDWLFGRGRGPRIVPPPRPAPPAPSRAPSRRRGDTFAFDGLDTGSREHGTAASSGAAPGSSGASVAAVGGALVLAAGVARAEQASTTNAADPPSVETATPTPEAPPSRARDDDAGDGVGTSDPSGSDGANDAEGGGGDGGGDGGGGGD